MAKILYYMKRGRRVTLVFISERHITQSAPPYTPPPHPSTFPASPPRPWRPPHSSPIPAVDQAPPIPAVDQAPIPIIDRDVDRILDEFFVSLSGI